jgi:CMP-N-acetylneuraminic acid synthetase
MKIVGFIPIRLNSQRVSSKSIRLLGGRPLFCWLAQEMDQLGIPVHIFASAPDILRDLMDFSANNIVFTKRPERLDAAGVTGVEIYREFVKTIPADVYLLSHCTSPFIKATSLQRVVDVVTSGQARSSLTARRIQTFTWYEGRPLNFDIPRIQTQLLRPMLVETSAAYCFRRQVLEEGDRTDLHPHIIEVKWPEDEDVDYEEDFQRCEAVANLVRQRM